LQKCDSSLYTHVKYGFSREQNCILLVKIAVQKMQSFKTLLVRYNF